MLTALWSLILVSYSSSFFINKRNLIVVFSLTWLDSAKAFKVRGTARRYLGKYEEAIHDLYQGNKLDWDEVTDALIKSIKDRVERIVEVCSA